MKLPLLVYLAGLSESIMCALIMITVLLGMLCLFRSLQDEKIHKKSLTWFCSIILVCSLLPSKTTVYTMLVVSDDRVQSIGSNALDIIDSKLKEIKESESNK